MKKYKNQILGTAVALIAIPIFVALLLHAPGLNNVFGSDDGWLGFWGGYLGAIVAIVGVWWQTNKTIKNEKELMFSQKRPYIVLRELNVDKVDKIYGSEVCTLDDNFQVLAIKNLSDQPFFSVKILFDEEKSPIVIDRINENDNIGIVVNSKDVRRLQKAKEKLLKSFQTHMKGDLHENKRWYDEAVKEIEETFSEYKMDFDKLDLQKNASNVDDNEFRIFSLFYRKDNKFDNYITKITKQNTVEQVTIYFTTTVREKVKLVFKKEKGNYKYQKQKTKLENKGENISEDEYDTSNLYESNLLKVTNN